MSEILIKFKQLHPEAKLPTKAHPTDTGYDLFCVTETLVPARGNAVVPVGISVVDVTPGYWYLILPKSGLGFKHKLQPHLGVIDNGYRSSLDVQIYNFSDKDYTYNVGDKVAQLAFYPIVHASTEWSDEVTTTDRGANGFGSTGK
jgi:dUTP pyrophosphatase